MSAMFFLLNVAIGNSPAYIYSLTPFPFLEHQTSRFYHTSEANLVPLLIFIAWTHIASFTSMFLRLILDWSSVFYSYCVHTCKKINTRLAFMYYPNGKETDQMVRNDIACNCIPLERIAFWYACNLF